MGNLRNFSITTALLSIINDCETKDVDYNIARYLLMNIKKIENMSIDDVCSECYVSISSIRRFCNRIGYDNFSSLKEKSIEYDTQVGKVKYRTELLENKDSLRKTVDQVLEACDKSISDDLIKKACKDIYYSDNIIIYSSESSSVTLKYLQQSLLAYKKVIKISTSSNFDKEEIRSMSQNDLFIFITISCIFLNYNIDIIKSTKAKKILITSTEDERFAGLKFDRILNMSKDLYLGYYDLYTTYGMSYLIDRLLLIYNKMYKDGELGK